MNINFISLIGAALVPMILGFIWYHPKVFGTVWMNESGMTDEKIKSGNMALIFGLSFVFSLMLAFIMNTIAIHDSFVGGALYYVTNKTMIPEVGSGAENWLNYYKDNLAASNHTFQHGAFHGFFIAGLFIALPIMATNALFERKSWKYTAVNVGYWLVCLAIMGGIIAQFA
jgi:hypothetical protein